MDQVLMDRSGRLHIFFCGSTAAANRYVEYDGTQVYPSGLEIKDTPFRFYLKGIDSLNRIFGYYLTKNDIKTSSVFFTYAPVTKKTQSFDIASAVVKDVVAAEGDFFILVDQGMDNSYEILRFSAGKITSISQFEPPSENLDRLHGLCITDKDFWVIGSSHSIYRISRKDSTLHHYSLPGENFRESGKARRGGLAIWTEVAATLLMFYLPLLFFIGYGNGLGLAGVVLLAIARVPGRIMMGTVVMHAAVHNALFERSQFNQIFSYGFDAGYGMSWINWRVQHNLLHHTFTNVAGLDDDLEYTAPMVTHGWFSDLRIGLTRFQHYYWPLAYALNLVLGPAVDFAKAVRYHRAGLYARAKVYPSDTPLWLIWTHLFGLKLIYTAIEFVIPVLVGIPIGHVIMFWLVATMLNSVMLITVFQFAHVVEGMPQFESTDAGKSMFRHQIETTANFRANTKLGVWLMDQLFGRLTYQIEHHLFPHINPIHYRVLSRIVQEEVARYNEQQCEDTLIYRTFPSLWTVICAHHAMVRAIAKNG